MFSLLGKLLTGVMLTQASWSYKESLTTCVWQIRSTRQRIDSKGEAARLYCLTTLTCRSTDSQVASCFNRQVRRRGDPAIGASSTSGNRGRLQGQDYYTLSRAGITRLGDSSGDFTPLDRWEKEYAIFHEIKRLGEGLQGRDKARGYPLNHLDASIEMLASAGHFFIPYLCYVEKRGRQGIRPPPTFAEDPRF